MMNPVHHLSINQVADALECSYSWIHALLSQGRIPFVRVAGHPVILATDLPTIKKIVRELKSRGPGRPKGKS